MASFGFHFRPSSKGGIQKGSIFVRIIHGRETASITTPYRVYPDEWNDKARSIYLIYSRTYPDRFRELSQIDRQINEDIHFLSQTISVMESSGKCTTAEIASAYRKRLQLRGMTFGAFVDFLSENLKEAGCERTAKAYGSAARKLQYFVGKRSLRLEEVDFTLIKKFEQYLQNDGLGLNTISFYMRNLRAIYNKALKQNLISPPYENPFSNVFTGVHITKKRALTKNDLIMLANLDSCLLGPENPVPHTERPAGGKLSPNKHNQALRDSLALFLFSFQARGMSFVDMAYLKKDNINDGVLSYFRKKTGQLLEISLTPSMKAVIAHFAVKMKDSPYLFPIIRYSSRSDRAQYENGLRYQNRRLKELARIAGISKPVSTHVARHSWATIAKQENLPLAVISEGLGHSNEKTTCIYLASFDRSVLDKANEKVCRVLQKNF